VRRRDFFRYGAVLGTVLGAPASMKAALRPEARASQPGGPPNRAGDLAVVNARIITLDPKRPNAEAALVRSGRLALVGSSDEVRAAAGRTPVFDAEARTVVPGFIDAHCHMEVATSAASYMVSVHTPPHSSLAGVIDTLRKKAAATPKGEWVIGRGSFNLQNNVTEKRLLTITCRTRSRSRGSWAAASFQVPATRCGASEG